MMARNKTSKKGPPQHPKLKKDPGIPKLISLQAKVDAAALKNKGRSRPGPSNTAMDTTPSVSSLAALAAAVGNENDQSLDGASSSTITPSKKHYIRTLHKVIEQSDIIIMVLDARDPEGCRSKLVEDEVRRREAEGKKLVLALNKIDLIPRENAEAWLRYLRHTAPTLPFKSSTQSQRTHLSSSTAPALLKLLKACKSKLGPSASITVGVVGYPNVGKSSLINSLKRAKVCPVAAEPGWTKDLQTVVIERGVRIVDSPGVIFDDLDQAAKEAVLLRNVIKVDDITDPISVVDQILARTPMETLLPLYSLPPLPPSDPDNPDSLTPSTLFLTSLALTTGRLLPGGRPDLGAAAVQLLRDWNSNKIPYWSAVPEMHWAMLPKEGDVMVPLPSADGTTTLQPLAGVVGDTTIVQAWAPAFDLGGLFWGSADKAAFDDSGAAAEGGMELDGGGVDNGAAGGAAGPGMDEDLPEMDRDDLTHIIPRKRYREPDSDEEDEYEPSQVRRMGHDGQEAEVLTTPVFGGEAPAADTDEIIPDGTPSRKRGPPTRGERRASKRRKKNPDWEMQLDIKDDGSSIPPPTKGGSLSSPTNGLTGNRAQARKQAKKARKEKERIRNGVKESGMVLDSETQVPVSEFTFTAGHLGDGDLSI